MSGCRRAPGSGGARQTCNACMRNNQRRRELPFSWAQGQAPLPLSVRAGPGAAMRVGNEDGSRWQRASQPAPTATAALEGASPQASQPFRATVYGMNRRAAAQRTICMPDGPGRTSSRSTPAAFARASALLGAGASLVSAPSGIAAARPYAQCESVVASLGSQPSSRCPRE